MARIAECKLTPGIKPAKLLEREVTRQVCDFMRWRQWRPMRLQSALMTNPVAGVFRVGEKGMVDYAFLRFFEKPIAAALVLLVEFKAPAGKVRPEQAEWHERERARGAVVWVVDSLDEFERRYGETFGWLHRGDKAVGQRELEL